MKGDLQGYAQTLRAKTETDAPWLQCLNQGRLPARPPSPDTLQSILGL